MWRDRFRRALTLLLTLVFCLGVGAASAPVASADDPKGYVDYGPPKDPPKEWSDDGKGNGWSPGIGLDDQNHWCNTTLGADVKRCDTEKAIGEIPGTYEPCSDVMDGCSKDDLKKHELKKLKEWREKADHNHKNYKKLNELMTKCVNGGRTFQDCSNEHGSNYPMINVKTPWEWVGDAVASLATDMLTKAAEYIGKSVVWVLKQFADAFNSWSTIKLGQTGIGSTMSIMTGLSVLLAAFLLLLQFGKLAISQQGAPLATALTGLAKWAIILAVYVVAIQTALDWSDQLSTAVINETFKGGGSGEKDAAKAMQTQLGELFAGLGAAGGTAAAGGALITGSGMLASSVGFVIVVGILCILAIGALWIEMLMRQAGLMVLVAVMPIVLAGQMADSTREWWPKARNAVIALILMKPVIVICFSIGFNAMSEGKGARNVLVGLMIFVLSCFAWPVIARFMTFTTNGDGNSTGSALFGAMGSNMSVNASKSRPQMGGAGMMGGGAGFTMGLEDDNASTASSGSNSGGGGGFWSKFMNGSGAGGFGSKLGGVVSLGLQAAAVGKDILEDAGANTAAHAGLGPASSADRHVIIGRRGQRGGGGGGGGGGDDDDSAPPPPAAGGYSATLERDAPADTSAPPLPPGGDHTIAAPPDSYTWRD
ncbi:hypothetical protein [Streptomyces lonegramiae]|uniref:TrbL/VirB6 plasmid conjugal transfer protein n=1 Tax=Streptomyces lonegramiae TaxID=3075524 RepID=A0ABU2XFU7_9ACTN|nr:hypothetical protein [Streptomyces sp. DSM 41529]MDT0543970.1 hypothetical protein [Streptomyces sp. DSM 41529]